VGGGWVGWLERGGEKGEEKGEEKGKETEC
jgi:hypothetical protein